MKRFKLLAAPALCLLLALALAAPAAAADKKSRLRSGPFSP